MSWSDIVTVGGHRVYGTTPTARLVEDGGVVVGNLRWTPSGGRTSPTGQTVLLYVPVGGPSGEDKSVVVRMPDDRVEVWPRCPKKVKETDDDDEL